jgi:tetratricopeptide (TPR) repeat protein
MSAKKVFISYSHDSNKHRERVLALSERLRADGIETVIDQYVKGSPGQGWPRWMLDQVDAADSVLVICTQTYYRRFRGHEKPGKGKGVDWEGALITQEIYDSRSNTLKFVPVLFSAKYDNFIPEPLRGCTYYTLTSESSYQTLYDFLLEQAGVEPGLVGQPRKKPRPRGTPLTFVDESGAAMQPAISIDLGRLTQVGVTTAEDPGGLGDPRLTVVGIEFVADGPLSDFDEAEWQSALRGLLGKDVSRVRIASIRRGSTVVRVLGDPEVIARAFEKLRTSNEFQATTGLRSYSGVLSTRNTEKIFGRADELAELDKAWAEQKTNVLSIVGFGGVGKSHLVAHWLNRLATAGWRGAERVFDWSFYSQGVREQGTVSADAFIAAALVYFGDVDLARSAASPWEKGERLAHLVAQRRTLLVLDGMEPLQHPPGPLGGQLRDPAVAALLRSLARHNPGLCLVTSRASVTDLERFRGTTAPEWALLNLSVPAGSELLRTLGVHGKAAEFRRAVKDVGGHAFTLYVLGSYLVSAHHGNISRRDKIRFGKANKKLPASYTFETLNAYEEWLAAGGKDELRRLAVLRVLGLFDRPADFGCLAALRRKPAIAGLTEPLVDLNDDEWNNLITTLAESGLVSVKTAHSALDAHPIIREYFAEQLRKRSPDSWRLAHGRLYEHLKGSTKDKDEPTLEDLQPLYQAVAHGCQAGRQQGAYDEVYRKRILRGHERISWRKLGAFSADLGAISCFFTQPYTGISPALEEPDRAIILQEAALGLRALGRLTEALPPMRAAIEMAMAQFAWDNVARGAGNLSELELTLGDLQAAVGDALRSVEYSDRSRDLFIREVMRTVLADALHQAGRRAEAEALFLEAEAMQRELEPDKPMLYSARGFRYCDFLIAESERVAWNLMLVRDRAPKSRFNTTAASTKRSIPSRTVSNFKGKSARAKCVEVVKRTEQTLSMVQREDWLLDIALDHLTLGRASLYIQVLDRSLPDEEKAKGTNLRSAVDGLRRAGMRDQLPRAFLSRAWLRFLNSDPNGAQADLDEALEIAEREPMRLFMADMHLYRARLFHAVKPYPWNKFADGKEGRGPKDDLADARKLIEECGYWRRKEELEDAEEAAKGWT